MGRLRVACGDLVFGVCCVLCVVWWSGKSCGEGELGEGGVVVE
jgi:hypothetical protein